MATGFNGLDDAAPNDNAYIGDGAGEIRAVKAALVTTFPNVNGEITKPSNYGTGGTTQPSESDYAQLFTDMSALVNPQTSNSPVVPQGVVTMWAGDPTNGTAITDLNNKGWYLCTGGTAPNGYVIPNLQNRFVKGWGDATVGSISGGGTIGTLRTGKALVPGAATDKTVTNPLTLTEANIPAHDHYAFVAGLGERNYIDGGASNSTMAADSGSSSGQRHIESDMRVSALSGTPNCGVTGKWGNQSPTPVDAGLDAAEFNHEHEVEVSGDLEPSHYVIAYIVYAGVV